MGNSLVVSSSSTQATAHQTNHSTENSGHTVIITVSHVTTSSPSQCPPSPLLLLAFPMLQSHVPRLFNRPKNPIFHHLRVSSHIPKTQATPSSLPPNAEILNLVISPLIPEPFAYFPDSMFLPTTPNSAQFKMTSKRISSSSPSRISQNSSLRKE